MPRRNKQQRRNRGMRRRGEGRLANPASVPFGDSKVQVTIPLSWTTIYSCVAATPLAQGLSITTQSPFVNYAAWANQIGAYYSEYRVDGLRVRVIPVPGVSAAGLFTTGLFSAPFAGQDIPTATIAVISKLPKHSITALFDKTLSYSWTRTDDPEDRTFVTTNGNTAMTGGLVFYIGAAAPTLSVAYMTIEVTAMVRLRGRRA